ncbi:MAG TPA: hypothetical protein VK558_09125 [Patescibacteria group bacterium]|nr:hypothetical protein [Patescibacteria group bacterium]
MTWTDMMKDGLRKALDSDIGKELAQKAKNKAEEGLDMILGGKAQEGEQLIDEAKQDAQAAKDASDQTEADKSSPDPTEH